MKVIPAYSTTKLLSLAVLMVCSTSLSAQSVSYVMVSPAKVTLLVGESKSFRLVDQNGRMQHYVSWSITHSDAFETVEQGDEFTITAKERGEAQVSARSPQGSAEATVTVVEGNSLPIGTVIWSSGNVAGCKATKIIPAVPSANGPDLYEQSQCEDGQYIAAYTAEGTQLWRRKINRAGVPAAAPAGEPSLTAGRLDPRSPSICDTISLGASKQMIRELLHDGNISLSEGAPGDSSWTVQESKTQCKLWFDENSVLTKKRKIFTTE